MIKNLTIINLPTAENIDQDFEGTDHFILKTCQRTLIITLAPSFEASYSARGTVTVTKGEDAYRFLLETICGLKSRLTGENEIVSQFKQAYSEYTQSGAINTRILTILEKLFKDAKDIRSKFLLRMGQYSYAGISKKLLLSNLKENDSKKFVIVGSGALCEDLLKVTNKKLNIAICARNQEKAKELSTKYNTEIIPWDERTLLTENCTIVNTVGSDNLILFDENFFNQWQQNHNNPLFIDLGSPSVIKTSHGQKRGIIRLEQIFEMADLLNKEKIQRVEKAKSAIEKASVRRWNLWVNKFNSDFEEEKIA